MLTQTTIKFRKPLSIYAKINRLALAALLLLSQGSAAAVRPQVAIVIDDLLRSPTTYQALFNIPVSLNFAVIPGFENSVTLDRQISALGQDVLVHFPMQTTSHPLKHYTFKLDAGMDANEIRYNLLQAFKQVPHAVGLNNHMGSNATHNRKTMQLFMTCYRAVNQQLQREDRFFLDSRTIGNTQAALAAKDVGLRTFSRNVFLDGEDNDAYVHQQLQKLIAIAKQSGFAVGICHPRPHTIRVLVRELPELRRFVSSRAASN